MIEILDVVGVTISIIGTYIVSIFGNRIGYRLTGFICYLISNIIMSYTFYTRGMHQYMFLQFTFMVSSVIGIYRNKDALRYIEKPVEEKG